MASVPVVFHYRFVENTLDLESNVRPSEGLDMWATFAPSGICWRAETQAEIWRYHPTAAAG